MNRRAAALTADCQLPTANCQLLTANCLLPTAYCFLLTAYGFRYASSHPSTVLYHSRLFWGLFTQWPSSGK
jgi:hypothetical protein